MTQPLDDVGDPSPGAMAETARSWSQSAVWWIAVLGIPASLTSPGATVSMALVGLYGVVLLWREGGLADDLRAVHRYMATCYGIVLVADALNGGTYVNLTTTGVNYLPLLALAPYAHALRRLELSAETVERAVQVTLLLALANSVIRAGLLDEYRPGGPNLAPIGYGLVVSVWAVFLLSGALENGRAGLVSLAIAVLGFVPVSMTESKIDVACLLFGCAVVLLLWARHRRRWRMTLTGIVVASLPIALGLYLVMGTRIQLFWNELALFLANGTTPDSSFGERYELNAAGLRAFAESPFLGHGFAERMSAVNENVTPGGPDISRLSYVHNDYVTHLVAFGAAGIVFLALFMGFVWLVLRRLANPGYRRMSVALPGMLMLYMLADVVFNMDPVSGLLVVVIGTMLATDRSAAPRGTIGVAG